jgi:hypothetical protein
MFYVFDSVTNSHVFTVIDPLTDGYDGPKETDVTLDEVFDMTVKDGERYPEPFLGRSKEDPRFFRVFRNRSECVASNFQPLALNWENCLWWSDRTAAANKDFSEVADEFIEKVKSKKIVGTTEVNVVYYCMDLTDHQPLPTFRMSMVANTTVRADGDPEFRQAARERDALVGSPKVGPAVMLVSLA